MIPQYSSKFVFESEKYFHVYLLQQGNNYNKPPSNRLAISECPVVHLCGDIFL